MTNNIIDELKNYGYTSHIAIPTTTALYRYPYNPDDSSTNDNTPAKAAKKSSDTLNLNDIKQDHSPGISFDIDKPFPEEACKIVAHISSDNDAKAIADKCGCAYFHYRGEDTYTFSTKRQANLMQFNKLPTLLTFHLMIFVHLVMI